MSKISLFDMFSPVSEKEWKAKIQYDLKGADYNDSLVWESPEGIKVKPFYHQDSTVQAPTIPREKATWNVGQQIYAGTAQFGNTKALAALRRGVESLCFKIPSPAVSFSELLKDIPLESTPVYLEFEFLSASYCQSIIDFAGEAIANVHFNLDCIGHLARTGNWFQNWEGDFEVLRQVLKQQNTKALSVDASLYQNAGANMTQQLAYALAHANEYLNAFSKLDNNRFTMHFKVAIGPNYFFEIAKIRALRLLWKTLAKEYGVATHCHISAMPGKRNKTLYDYNTNMLRTATECMAAVLGGADMVVNLAYDAIYHKDNEFGERIALNQLLLLKNESYFDTVTNAPDGAYYMEAITTQLAEKALQLFKSVESGGGFLSQLKNHTIQKKIQEAAKKELEKFNNGTTVLVGTNKYQNDTDKMKDTIEIYPFLKTKVRKTLIQPILEKRLAEGIEQNRLNDE